MNKQTLIITIIIGLGIGIFFAFQSRPMLHEDHMNASSTRHDHPSHSDSKMHETNNSTTHNMPMVSDYTSSLTHYFSLQDALAKDNLENAKLSSNKLVGSLGEESDITPFVKQIQTAKIIQEARSQFENISQAMETLVHRHGIPQGMTIVKVYCPMVNHNKGASWLQNHDRILNPYFGKAMLHCGTMEDL